MEMVIKIWGENPKLLEKLLSLKFEAKLVKHGILCQPGYDQEEKKFFIPEIVQGKKFSLMINCVENGGAATNTGQATVVCSLSGDKLSPYFVPSSGELSNGVHAFFSVPEAVTTVTAHRKQSDIEIMMYLIERLDNFISLETEKVWVGSPQDLPKMYSMYEAAVKAAKEKAECYHCRCVHYAAV